uniref:Uncharacterized protein n=1 Tax=Timema bartmani TaxID=61472 RepID=A0A7R9FA03_9NEOP|nr:unnamed protein product [Timema bartmani]
MFYDCLLLISTLLIATGGLMASPLPISIDNMMSNMAQAVPIVGKMFMPSKNSCSEGFWAAMQDMGLSMPGLGVAMQKLPIIGPMIMGNGKAAGIPGASTLIGMVPPAKKMLESVPFIADFLFGTKGGCSPPNMKAKGGSIPPVN